MPAGKVKAYTRLLRAMFKGQFKATLVRRGDWLPVVLPAWRASLPLVQLTPEGSPVHIAWGFALCQIEEPTLTVEPSIWSSTQPPIFGDVHFLMLALRQMREPASRQNLTFGRQLSLSSFRRSLPVVNSTGTLVVRSLIYLLPYFSMISSPTDFGTGS